MEATGGRVGDGRPPLLLSPPLGDKPLEKLEVTLRLALEDGRFGTAEVAQDVLEFAALASQPGCLHKVAKKPGALNKYAGFMIDAITAYGNSATLDIWIVEALVSIHRVAGDARDQLSLPIFDAFVKVAMRNSSDSNSELHDRLVGALAAVSSPDCRFTDALTQYVINQMQLRQGKMSTLALEHSLALLGVARSKFRLKDQIRLVLGAPMGNMSEAPLAARAMITLSDMYSLVAELAAPAAKPQRQGANVSFAWSLVPGAFQEYVQDIDESVVHDYGVPKDGKDVRLAMTLLDLHRKNRKVAGAALRTFAAMCRLTRNHMAAILVDESRGLIIAQEEHSNSRAVNMHAAEVVLVAAARPSTMLISGPMVALAARAVRAFPRDVAIVNLGLQALHLIAEDEALLQTIQDAFPPTELIRIGEAHCTNSGIMRALCNLISVQCNTDGFLRDELVRSGAVAVPFRAMEAALEIGMIEEGHPDGSASEACAAAARAVLNLTFRSEDALFHVAKIDGGVLFFDILDLYRGEPKVIHASLMALKNIAHNQTVRRQIVVAEERDSWRVFGRVLRAADSAVDKDPDILAQACCALSTLTTVEGFEPVEDTMRNSIDQEYLSKIVTKTIWHWPRFALSGDLKWCLRIIVMAAKEPHKQRLLDDRGSEIYVIGKGRNDRVAAWDELDEAEQDVSSDQPLQLPDSDDDVEPKDKVRGLDLTRPRRRIEAKPDTFEISTQTDEASTRASTGGEDTPSDSGSDAPPEKAAGRIVDALLGSDSDRGSEGSAIFKSSLLEPVATDTRRDTQQQIWSAIGWGDSEDDPNPRENRAMRRRMHVKNHGFGEKTVPRLTPEKPSQGGWLSGLLPTSEEEPKAEEDEAKKGEEGAPEEEEPSFFSGWEKWLDSDNESDDPAKTGKAEENEDDEDPDDPVSSWFEDDEVAERRQELRRQKRQEEKERLAREEAEKNKGFLGRLWG